jgi:TP901 family phage tail tape measure protein
MAQTELKFIISSDASGAITGIDSVSQKLKGMGDTAEDSHKRGSASGSIFSGVLGNIGTVAAGMGVTFGAMEIGSKIMEGAQAAMGFQTEWQKVSVILRDTPAETVTQLKQAILDMPPALGSAKEMSAALYQTISSGITDPLQAMKFLEQAAIAAKGGFTDTETVVKAGTTVLAAYGLQASDTEKIMNVMAKTVDIGKVEFSELAAGIGQVAPIAAANNISFAEMSAAVAQYSLVAPNASQAITGIRSAIDSIMAPTSKAADVAAKLNVEWDAQALKTKGLAGVLEQLKGRTDITTADIVALTGRVEATNAVLSLTTEQGFKGLTEASQSLSKQFESGTASVDSFNKRNETLAGQLDNTKAALTKIAESIGAYLEPAIKKAVEIFNGLLSIFTSTGEEANKQQTVWSGIATWFGSTFGELFATVKSIWNDIASLFGESDKNTALTALKFFGTLVGGIFTGIGDIIKGALEVIRGVISTVCALMRGDWEGAWNGIKTIFKGVWDMFKGIVEVAWAPVKAYVDTACSELKTAWTAFTGGLDAAWKTIWNGIRPPSRHPGLHSKRR